MFKNDRRRNTFKPCAVSVIEIMEIEGKVIANLVDYILQKEIRRILRIIWYLPLGEDAKLCVLLDKTKLFFFPVNSQMSDTSGCKRF